MLRVNIGCGPDYRNGFVNYDLRPVGDVCGDCEEGLPFKDNSFDEVLASHILEHIHNLRKLKTELLRVMKPEARIIVIVPYYLSPDAWGDDTHCRAFSRQSFFLDFWPGFRLIKLAGEGRTKVAINEKVTWLVAHLRKESNEEERQEGIYKRLLKKIT